MAIGRPPSGVRSHEGILFLDAPFFDAARASRQVLMHSNAHVGNVRAARMGGIHFVDPP